MLSLCSGRYRFLETPFTLSMEQVGNQVIWLASLGA